MYHRIMRVISIQILSISLLVFVLGACTKSMAPSKEDPTLLTFLVSNAGPPASPEQLTCLGNLSLLNSCIGGTTAGEGFSGVICSGNGSPEEQALGSILSTPFASACIIAAIQETSCNLTPNKSVNIAEALEGPFAGLGDCVQEAIEAATPPDDTSGTVSP